MLSPKEKESQRRYRRNHPERVKKASKDYRKRYPGKARMACLKWRQRNPERVKFLRERWKKLHPREVKQIDRRSLAKKHGLTLEQYEGMLAFQKNRCAICGDLLGSKSLAHLDHCHSGKRVRGFLCSRCNLGLGQFRDSISTLLSAVRYLVKYLCE
jgi:hypothetical protein